MVWLGAPDSLKRIRVRGHVRARALSLEKYSSQAPSPMGDGSSDSFVASAKQSLLGGSLEEILLVTPSGYDRPRELHSGTLQVPSLRFSRGGGRVPDRNQKSRDTALTHSSRVSSEGWSSDHPEVRTGAREVGPKPKNLRFGTSCQDSSGMVPNPRFALVFLRNPPRKQFSRFGGPDPKWPVLFPAESSLAAGILDRGPKMAVSRILTSGQSDPRMIPGMVSAF